jgi:hypothetical protein
MTARKPPGEHHKRGRKPQPHSARNGGVRVTCIVSPTDDDAIRLVCANAGLTFGELLAFGAYHLLGKTTDEIRILETADIRKAKDT